MLVWFRRGDFLKLHGAHPDLVAVADLVTEMKAIKHPYDTQRIKGVYDSNDDATSAARKAVIGALSLYLNFINLFMMLLRLAGNRR